jgi:hypothetical protein
MAGCSNCGNRVFEIEEDSPLGSKFKLLFVQYASCGVPVSVLDYFNIGAMIEDQDAVVADHTQRLHRIEGLFRNLTDIVEDLRRK